MNIEEPIEFCGLAMSRLRTSLAWGHSGLSRNFYQPPRLGIIHLLAWTAIAAVMFKSDIAIRLLWKQQEMVVISNVLYQAIEFVDLTLMAAGVVGLAVLVRAWFRRQPGRFAPGHWILMFTVVPSTVMCVVNMAWCVLSLRLHENNEFLKTYWLVSLFYVATQVFCAVLFVMAARRNWTGRGWRGSFRLLAIVHAAKAVQYGVVAISPWQYYYIFRIVGWITGVCANPDFCCRGNRRLE